MSVPTSTIIGHAAPSGAPRIFAAELVDGLGVVITLNEDGDFDTPERTRAVAEQARQFANHLDRLADEQQAEADVERAITALEARLDVLRAARRRMSDQ